MSNLKENFFCKEGYIVNDEARTLDFSESDVYWTQERIDASSRYQYHVYKLAAKIAKQFEYSSGMDLGCGPGTKAKSFLSKALKDVTLVDQPSSAVLARAILPQAVFVGTNLENCVAILDRKFDLIVCADVLEHLYNPLPCLTFAYNHLAPLGTVIFSTPERDVLRGKNCTYSPHPSHVREWNCTEFKDLLEYSGFEIIQQMCLPAGKLSRIVAPFRTILNPLLHPTSWNSCQVAVCKKNPC